ncbi:hypothetical protein ACFSGX_12475 [Sphingomonas arantia]|uniref:Integrase catalytic domain-containing protein n=1 Tax=Sphingomonas arantia TaxID=1460676 RepID=A0ABW4U2Y5_9SPHN
MFGPRSDDRQPGSEMNRELVVWIDEHRNLIGLMHLKRDRYPRLALLSDITPTVACIDIVLEDSARIRPRWLDPEITEDEREDIKRRMDAIAPLVSDEPAIFDPAARGKLIGQRHRETGISRNSLKHWLHAFFRYGQCANALRNHYDRCGRKKGPAKEGWAKIGRPVDRDTDRKGHEPVTVALIREFENAVVRERKFAGDAFRISGAHTRWHDENCYDISEDAGRLRSSLKAKYANIDPADYEQFRRWYHSNDKAEETARHLLSDPIYEKDNRAITSTSTAETSGPGSRLQIDASEVNFALGSTLNRHRLVGRPYIYFVRDVWSRYICGYYLGFQPPSMVAASLALMSAFTRKDAVLRKFDFDPVVDAWDWHYVGGSLLHDGGELRGHQGDWLVGETSMTFEQTACDRGDLKGAVETLFHWSDVKWSSKVPGRRPDPRYRGRGRTPDDIALAHAGKLKTVFEFEREVILFILRFNGHVLKGYDADPDMVAAGIPRVPSEMLHWGIEHRGAPRSFDDEVVRFMLMPRADVSIYPNGIEFQNVRFTCLELRPLQARAAASGRKIRATISYDFKGDAVYWHDPSAPNGFRRCARADAHRWVDGLLFEEIAEFEAERNRLEQDKIVEERRVRAEDAARDRAEAARRAAEPLPLLPAQTRPEARKAKTQARANELDAELKEKFGSLLEGASEVAIPKPGGVVVPIRAVTTRNFAVPSVEDIEDDDE